MDYFYYHTKNKVLIKYKNEQQWERNIILLHRARVSKAPKVQLYRLELLLLYLIRYFISIFDKTT